MQQFFTTPARPPGRLGQDLSHKIADSAQESDDSNDPDHFDRGFDDDLIDLATESDPNDVAPPR